MQVNSRLIESSFARARRCAPPRARGAGPGLGDTGAGVIALLSIDATEVQKVVENASSRRDCGSFECDDGLEVSCTCVARAPAHCVTSCEILGSGWVEAPAQSDGEVASTDASTSRSHVYEVFAALGLRGGRCAVVRVEAERGADSRLSYRMETVALRPCGRGLAYGAVDTTAIAACPPSETLSPHGLRFATATLSGTIAAFTLLPSRSLKGRKGRAALRQDWSKEVTSSLISAAKVGRGWAFCSWKGEAIVALEGDNIGEKNSGIRFVRFLRPGGRVTAFASGPGPSLVFAAFPEGGGRNCEWSWS